MSVDYKLEGKVAIVTGSSSGMGKASAERLASQGVNLVMVSRNQKKLDEAANEIRHLHKVGVLSHAGDVGETSLPQIVIDLAEEKWGRCDILVNNSGGPPMGSFLEQNDETWAVAINNNLMSTIRFSTCASRVMLKNNWGRIINITSSLAKEPTAAMVLSATARAGVSAFSKSISSELAAKGITINTLCPGGVLTDRLVNLIKTAADSQNRPYEEVLQESQNSIPIGRFASTEEFADVLLFLASENGRYVTGVSLMVDGGLTKGVF